MENGMFENFSILNRIALTDTQHMNALKRYEKGEIKANSDGFKMEDLINYINKLLVLNLF